MKSVFGRPRLAVRVMLCGLSGHRAMKGLRRERGERVVLRFTFHYCQPFVRTLASAHCTYVALGLDILYMCVCEHVCVYCIQYVNEGRPLYYDQRENTSNIHHNYFHLGNWTTTFPQRRQAYKKKTGTNTQDADDEAVARDGGCVWEGGSGRRCEADEQLRVWQSWACVEGLLWCFYEVWVRKQAFCTESERRRGGQREAERVKVGVYLLDGCWGSNMNALPLRWKGCCEERRIVLTSFEKTDTALLTRFFDRYVLKKKKKSFWTTWTLKLE